MRSNRHPALRAHAGRLLSLSLLLTYGAVLGAPADIPSGALLQHIKFLSADELKGRGNGTPGLETAGEYVAQQFKTVGLQPGGPSSDWFQPFQLIAGLSVGSTNSLTIT